MTKPVITTRAAKGLALSYTELDTNFTNLRDATIGFTVSGSTANIDLNSALNVVAGTNISLALDTGTDTLTISSTAQQNLFQTVVAGGTSLVADSTTDTLTLTGGTGITIAGNATTDTATFSLTNTAVTAGSYTVANITVDAQGRITAASSGTAAQNGFQTVIAGSTSLVADSTTDVLTLTGGTGITISGNASTDTATITLANTAVTAGSYTNSSITVDAQGRITSASSGDAPVFLTYNEIAVGTAGSFTNLDFRNGTNTTLLSTLKRHMLVKARGHLYIYLPNYQNMNNQCFEFDLQIVLDRDFPSYGTVALVFRRDSDQSANMAYTYVGQPTIDYASSSPVTISGTTTISGGAVTSLTITAGNDNYGWGFVGTDPGSGTVDLRVNNAFVIISAPPGGGTQATAVPEFSGTLLTGFKITNPGSGYVTAPTFYVTTAGTTDNLTADHDIVWWRCRFVPSSMTGFKNRWFIEKVMKSNYRNSIIGADYTIAG